MYARLITILGPTASGKTQLAVQLAAEMNGEILSADSRQVYRHMDLGTGKDLSDYQHPEVGSIPYHLIDICEPGTKYNLFQYQQDFHEAYEGILARHHQPILCGGTGLYLEAVLKGYHLSPVPQNPDLRKELEGYSLAELTERLEALKQLNHSTMHNRTDVDTAQRAIRAIEIEEYNRLHPTEERALPAIESTIFGIDIEREQRRAKITRRLKERLDHGMLDEIRTLLAKGIPAADLIYYGLEYKYLTLHVIGQLSYEEMFRQLEIAIHQFAKRQMTWFRGMEHRGFKIHWIDAALPTEEKIKIIHTTLENEQSTKQ